MRIWGWCLSIAGCGWLGILALAAVTSDDIAQTYLLEFGIVTGSLALMSLTLGMILIRAGRAPREIPLVSRVTDAPSPRRGESP
jgi:hypothetical protein